MPEAVLNKVQMGIQSAHGTPVAATAILPVEPGTLVIPDRAPQSAREDVGRLGMHNPGRGYYGVRNASLTQLSGEITYDDFMRVFEMHAAGGIAPSTVAVAGRQWDYAFDETADTTKRGTIEAGTESALDQWEISDSLVNELEFGFDDMTVGGASPWRFAATVLGKDRDLAALTGSLAVPSILETALGHETTFFEGPTSTVFGSLAEDAGTLIQFRARSVRALTQRAYGGADTFSAYGLGPCEITFTARLKMSSDTATEVLDIYDAAGPVMGERRWRIKATGTVIPSSSPATNKSLTVDSRVRFTAIPVGDRAGEHVWDIAGYMVFDATLATRCKVSLVSATATLP